MAGESAIGRFGSGRDVPRIEDAALLAGAGQFTDDVSLPGQAYLSFLARLTPMRASSRSMPPPLWPCRG
jgi:CO/xanthine dehydrogenase Mo-binding subunit